MDKLGLYRKKIDSIDKNIVRLLEARFRLAWAIGAHKRKNNLAIKDKKRESSILTDIKKHSSSPHRKFFEKTFAGIIKYCRKIQ